MKFTSYQYHCVQVFSVVVSVCLNTSLVVTYFFHLLCTLHTVAGPAVQAAVKTVLSYQNDMIIGIFSANSKNKDKAKVALASWEFLVWFDEEQKNVFEIAQLLSFLVTLYEQVAILDTGDPFLVCKL